MWLAEFTTDFALIMPIFEFLISGCNQNNDNTIVSVLLAEFTTEFALMVPISFLIIMLAELALLVQIFYFYYQVATGIMIIKWRTLVSCDWLNSKLNLHLWCQFSNFYYQVAIRVMILKWHLVSFGRLNSKLNVHLWYQFFNS